MSLHVPDAREMLQNGDIEIVFEDQSQADGDDAGEDTEVEGQNTGQGEGEAIAGRRQSQYISQGLDHANETQTPCAYYKTFYKAEMDYKEYCTEATSGW